MDIVDRYLQAVGFWLPKAQKQDILAELSEELRSQMEERESELGRQMNEGEAGEILKKMGRPMLVANRYQPQQHLIGPAFFPIYKFVLKVVAICYLAPWVLVWIGLTIARATQSSAGWVETLGSAWESSWLTALLSFAIVTTVFASLERLQVKCGLENWDPQKLPPVRNANRIPRVASTIELIANMVFCTWWVGGTTMVSRNLVDLSAVQITMTPVWRYFFWGYLAVTLVNIGLAAANLARPWRTRMRASVRLVSDLAGSALFCWLLKGNVFASISMVNVPPAKAAEFVNAINWWGTKMFPYAIIVGAILVAVDLYRVLSVDGTGVGRARGLPSGGLTNSAVS